MFKLIENTIEKGNIIYMKDMDPGDIGVIQNTYDIEAIVMRTFSIDKFEVINLSTPGGCWTNPKIYAKVKLLKKGEKITLEVI